MTEAKLLSNEEIAEVEAHFHLTTDGDAVFVLSRAPALCATVRALRAENEKLKEHADDLEHDLDAAIKECNEHHG